MKIQGLPLDPDGVPGFRALHPADLAAAPGVSPG